MNPLASTLLEGSWLGLIVAGVLALALPWIDRNTKFRAVPIAIAVALTIRYLYWRVTETVPPTDQLDDIIAGIIFLAIELMCVSGMILSFITLSRTRNRTPEVAANAGWLKRQRPMPLVDVFICTYNEEEAILERTIIGAMSMDYPNYRVWVLDDGNREWLRGLAETAGCGYVTRSDNAHAKAGNINSGLRHVMALDEKPSFISILDADFVPAKKFLSRALTLFREPDVGIVQTPQHFINPDPIQNNLAIVDLMPDEQRYFFDVLMQSKDAWGTAFCCGTSSVIRASALVEIDGMPTDSVTEDYLLTLRMQRSGYRTVYLNERLSLGLAPEGLKEYVTQRSRWCLGFMQIIRGKDGPFRLDNGLRLRDRLSLMESFFYWTSGFAFRIACLLVPVLYLLFDIRAVNVGVVDAVEHFLPYYVAQIAVIAWLSERRVIPVITDLTQLLAAREVLRAAFVGLAKPKNRKFQVTAKGGDRGKTYVQWRMMSLYVLLLGFTIAGLLLTFTFDPVRSWQSSAAVALYWSWYNVAILVAAIAVCVERPRFRKDERLRARDIAWVGIDGKWQYFLTEDISVSGLRLAGVSPAAIGTAVRLRVDGKMLAGQIARFLPGSFAVAVDDTLEARTAMIALVHSGRFHSSVQDISTRAVAQRLLGRLFG
jgi:cellulose synthase (UDP-forming)